MKKWIKNNWKSVLKKIFYPHDALIAMLALQTAMLAQFGSGQKTFARYINSCTGGVVCLTIFIMAIIMVHRSNKQIRKMEASNG